MFTKSKGNKPKRNESKEPLSPYVVSLPQSNRPSRLRASGWRRAVSPERNVVQCHHLITRLQAEGDPAAGSVIVETRPPSCVKGVDRVDLRVFQDVGAWTIAHDIDAISGDDAVLDLYFAGSMKVEARPAVLVRLQVIKDGQRGVPPSRPVSDKSFTLVVVHHIPVKSVETVVARRAVCLEPEAGILRARCHVVDKMVPRGLSTLLFKKRGVLLVRN